MKKDQSLTLEEALVILKEERPVFSIKKKYYVFLSYWNAILYSIFAALGAATFVWYSMSQGWNDFPVWFGYVAACMIGISNVMLLMEDPKEKDGVHGRD